MFNRITSAPFLLYILLLLVVYCTYTKTYLNLQGFWALIYAAHSPTLYIFFRLRLLVLNRVASKRNRGGYRKQVIFALRALLRYRKLFLQFDIHIKYSPKHPRPHSYKVTHSHKPDLRIRNRIILEIRIRIRKKARSSSGAKRKTESGSELKSQILEL